MSPSYRECILDIDEHDVVNVEHVFAITAKLYPILSVLANDNTTKNYVRLFDYHGNKTICLQSYLRNQ